MFFGREDELEQIQKVLEKENKQAILIYGKRRVGKSALIIKAVEHSTCKVFYYECLLTSITDNLKNIEKKMQKMMNNRFLHFESFSDVFEYLGTIDEKIIVILDEYSYLKSAAPKYYTDSLFQTIIDGMKDNVRLVLLGSYVSMMKELLEEDNPLFGRFSLILNVRPFDYYTSSFFYPNVRTQEKVEYYSVFGGTPFAGHFIDSGKGLKENIVNLLLNENGILHTYIEHVLLAELMKVSNANMILAVLSNGKKRYSDIENILDMKTNGNLDKQLKSLLDMEIIHKVYPINKKNDRKKIFYEISDNLVRFYYYYIYQNKDVIRRIGENSFYELYIRPSITTYISHRFEEIVREYFSRISMEHPDSGIYDIGSFWYDIPGERKNGEFDCVLRYKDTYSVYEVKYYMQPMDIKEARKEWEQVKKLESFMKIRGAGFVCLAGFSFENEEWELINGDALYCKTEHHHIKSE